MENRGQGKSTPSHTAPTLPTCIFPSSPESDHFYVQCICICVTSSLICGVLVIQNRFCLSPAETRSDSTSSAKPHILLVLAIDGIHLPAGIKDSRPSWELLGFPYKPTHTSKAQQNLLNPKSSALRQRESALWFFDTTHPSKLCSGHPPGFTQHPHFTPIHFRRRRCRRARDRAPRARWRSR